MLFQRLGYLADFFSNINKVNLSHQGKQMMHSCCQWQDLNLTRENEKFWKIVSASMRLTALQQWKNILMRLVVNINKCNFIPYNCCSCFIAELCLTLCNPMDHNATGFTVLQIPYNERSMFGRPIYFSEPLFSKRGKHDVSKLRRGKRFKRQDRPIYRSANRRQGTSLVVHWLRINLLMQETQVWLLVWEELQSN